MTLLMLITIPLISAFIGWGTNYLAVKMLFHPYKEWRFAGVSIQGLLPKRKRELAQKIGETVEKELISHEDIQGAVNNPAFHKEVTERVLLAIETTINTRLASNPLFALFLTGATAKMVKDLLAEEVEKQVPTFMESMFERMEEVMDVKSLVEQKIHAYDMRKLEEIVYAIAAKELRAIEVFGAILGGIIGGLQVLLIISMS